MLTPQYIQHFCLSRRQPICLSVRILNLACPLCVVPCKQVPGECNTVCTCHVNNVIDCLLRFHEVVTQSCTRCGWSGKRCLLTLCRLFLQSKSVCSRNRFRLNFSNIALLDTGGRKFHINCSYPPSICDE